MDKTELMLVGEVELLKGIGFPILTGVQLTVADLAHQSYWIQHCSWKSKLRQLQESFQLTLVYKPPSLMCLFGPLDLYYGNMQTRLL